MFFSFHGYFFFLPLYAGSYFVQPINIRLLRRMLHFSSPPMAGDHGDERQKAISMATAAGCVTTKGVAVMTEAVMAAATEVQSDD